MINSIQNICSEFSDCFDVSGNTDSILIKVDIEIEDLGDLATVLDPYGLELTAIESVTDVTSKCQAVFFKALKEDSRKN